MAINRLSNKSSCLKLRFLLSSVLIFYSLCFLDTTWPCYYFYCSRSFDVALLFPGMLAGTKYCVKRLDKNRCYAVM